MRLGRNGVTNLLSAPYRPVARPWTRSSTPKRGDDLERRWHPGEDGRHPLESQAEQAGDDDHADQRGQRPWQAPLGVQFIEGEGPDRGQGAVGEVEDPGGSVGEDEPDGGEAVHRPGREADDDERQVFLHGWQTPQGRRPARAWTADSADSTGLPLTSQQSGR